MGAGAGKPAHAHTYADIAEICSEICYQIFYATLTYVRGRDRGRGRTEQRVAQVARDRCGWRSTVGFAVDHPASPYPYPYPYPFPALCRSGAAAFHCRPAKAAELGRGRYPRLCWDGHGRLPRRHEYRGNGRGREIDSSDFILARAGGAVAT